MDRHQPQVKSSIAGGRIALEDGHDATQYGDGKDGLVLELDADGCGKDKGVELEHHHEKGSKLIEYLYEKVPKHAYVGCQVGQKDAVCVCVPPV